MQGYSAKFEMVRLRSVLKVLQHEIPRCVDFGGDNLYRPQTMLDYITFRKSTMMRLN